MARLLLKSRPSSRVDFFTGNPYKEKIAELHSLVEKEAKQLDNVLHKKDVSQSELRLLSERQTEYEGKIIKLENELVDARIKLEQEVEKRTGFIEKAKSELRNRMLRLEERKVVLEEEVKTTRLLLKAETVKRIQELADMKLESKKEMSALQERKVSLRGYIELLEIEVRITKEELENEVRKRTELLNTSKVNLDKEIASLEEKRRISGIRVHELNQRLGLTDDILATKEELKKTRIEAEAERGLIASELKQLEAGMESANERKSVLLKDISEAEGVLIKEAKRQREFEMALREQNDKETSLLQNKKDKLLQKIVKLEGDVVEAQTALQEEITKKTAFVEDIKREFNAEAQRLNEARINVNMLTEQIEGLAGVEKELKDFVTKEKTAREKYLVEKTKLEIALKTNTIITTDSEKKMKELSDKNAQLDDYREKMTDLSGRLTTTLGYVRGTTEVLNERLKGGGIPLRFDLPPGQVLTVPF